MKHGSLFSGIGGFDLAAQWMGWENVFHCEWNEFGKRVLSYYWPNAISYHDITKTDFTIHRGGIDILTGGFPCQPYSMAGKRKGKDDERHLWPEMLRAIREIQPRWVVGENVLGLVNWDGGLVFDEVQADLESQGYEVQPYVLPACAVNAPHRRDRVWFVAYSKLRSAGQDGNSDKTQGGGDTSIHPQGQGGDGKAIFDSALCGLQGATPDAEHSGGKRRQGFGGIQSKTVGQPKQANPSGVFGKNGTTPDAPDIGLQQPRGAWERWAGFTHNGSVPDWGNFPQTQPTIRSGDDGFSVQLDGITFPKWRNESIKAAGNAIVPQVAYQIFRAIELYEIQNGAK
jgi:DNA (cytosine-5)-methyltransferase 1